MRPEHFNPPSRKNARPSKPGVFYFREVFRFLINASINTSRLGFFASKPITMPAFFIVSVVCGPMLPMRGTFASDASASAAPCSANADTADELAKRIASAPC